VQASVEARPAPVRVLPPSNLRGPSDLILIGDAASASEQHRIAANRSCSADLLHSEFPRC